MYKDVYKWIRIEKYKRFESSGYMAILTPVIFRQFASSDVLQSLVILSIQIFSICSIFNRLQEYLIKSFVMDDEQLKNPPVGSSVLERIRDIRASMRRVYLQVICPPSWLSANCIAIKVKMLFYTLQNTLFYTTILFL